MRKKKKRQYAVRPNGETLLPLTDEKSICYRAIINYVPQRMVQGARGFGVSARNRTPTQLVRQPAEEKE